jgi:opacity protein-like surface antigen
MKRLLALVLVALLVVSVTYAGDTVVPKTKAGNKALLFTFGGLSNLGAGVYPPPPTSDFIGGIGGKYYLSNNLALRLGVGFSTTTKTEKNPTSPTPTGQKGERDETTTSFTIAPGVTYNLAVTGPVVAYVGAQILYVSTNTSRDGAGGNGFDSDSKVETSASGFGAGAILGVEWFPWENISFGAEYALTFISFSGDTESTFDGTSTKSDGPSTTSIGTAALNGANLTIAVYF